MHDQLPDANGPTIVHTVVDPSVTVIRPSVSVAVPVIGMVAPTTPLGPVIVGACGAVRSISTVIVGEAAPVYPALDAVTLIE